MARTKGPARKSVTVGLSAGVYKAADEQRWSERMTFSEFVNHAVGAYLTNMGIEIVDPVEATEAADEKAAPADEKAAPAKKA